MAGFNDRGCETYSSVTYNRFRSYLESACGIMLGENKQFLVESRINKILLSNGISDLDALVNALESSPGFALKQQVVDAMTTNETMWFRDAHPYDWVRNHLFKAIAKTSRDHPSELRIWSAACSTGQEPYSMSMLVEEALRSGALPSSVQVKIIATDISKSALSSAQKGIYNERTLLRGMQESYISRYFIPSCSGCFEVRPNVKQRIEFRQANLKESFAFLGKFDLVLCRNVLIYFSSDLKRDILKRMHATIRPKGYLFLGGSESLNGLPDHFEMVKYHPGIVYRAK